jgi:integrase
LALLPLLPRSQQSYWACVRQLAEHFDRSPDLVSAEELRQYFIYLKTERRFSRQSSTQALCAIKLFWEKTLQRAWPAELELARATPQFKLPVILSAGEVRHVIARVPALDHRVALTTIYSCGLRLGEALKLEVGDIDSKRMFLHIRAGKGNRDRYVPLPQRTLELLRQLWRTHRHPRWLFPAKGHSGLGAATATEPMCRTTLQRGFRLALLGEEQREHMTPGRVGARVIRHACLPSQLRNQMIGNEVADLTQQREPTLRWLLFSAFCFHNRALWHGARQKPTLFSSESPSAYEMAVFLFRLLHLARLLWRCSGVNDLA